ncbi:MAG: zinc-dependent alcohol dehydrogenase family protein [Acidimicrobiia bacterium]
MKAAVFEEFGGPVEIREVPEPAPPAKGVVLKVGANGVCRSDWHAWIGHDQSITVPHVPGHELAGEIVALDSAVEGFSLGDRVTVPFVLGCGACAQCAAQNQQVCDNQYQPGFGGWGSFAEYVALPYADENLVLLPDSMSMSTAAGLGCRFATSFRAVVDQGQVKEGDHVAIWGCGGVGLSAVMIASALGATVHAVDIDPGALQLATQAGAAFTYRVEEGADVPAAIKAATGGGASVSIDALGSQSTCTSSIRSLRKRGRHIQVGLMLGDDAQPVIPMWRLHLNEIELFGAHGMQAWRYPAMLDMVGSGALNPQALVTERIALSQGAEHLTRMADFPGSGFVVIDDFTA